VGKFAKKMPKGGQKMKKMSNIFFTRCDTSETKHSRNAEIGTNIAHYVRMMPEPFAF